MRFVVYGAGAVGGVIGARLFQQGHDVTLIARGAQLAALREHGLRLDTPDESVTLTVPVAGGPAALTYAPGDVVLMAMKTQDTTMALAELAAAVPPEVVPELIVASAQNGVENERLALRRFPRVYGICVVLPATFLEPGAVEANMAPTMGSLDIGRYPSGVDETAGALAAAFTGAGFESVARPDIMRHKYGKLVMNLGNAVEAIITDGRSEIARLAREEGTRCLRAAGIETPADMRAPSGIRPVRGRARQGGSTYQSLRRGTGTIEADYLNGEVVLLGREHGVPTPVNELLRRLANEMARDRRSPGLMTADEFMAELDGTVTR